MKARGAPHGLRTVRLRAPIFTRSFASLASVVLAGCVTPRLPAAGNVRGSSARAAARSASPSIVAAPAPLRRLTNEEYNNTVRDLLGDTSRPADAFAPDEAVGGFENNTVSPITQVLVERYMSAAEGLAATAAKRLDKAPLASHASCAAGEPPEVCARRFVATFGRQAWRRPLDDAERAKLLALYAEKATKAGHVRGLQRVMQAVLQSPSFLYRVEPAPERGDGEDGATSRALTGFEIATRLSYFFWASTPDAALLDEAEAGRLVRGEDVEKAARRLLADPRAIDGIRSFHRQWLDLRELETTSKNPSLYPAFTPELKAAMVEETLRFSADAVLRGGDTVTTLLTSSRTFVNAALARLYGVEPKRSPSPSPSPRARASVAATGATSAPGSASAPDFAFVAVELPPGQRAGLLTQASVLSVLAYPDETSPILRGKFVREKLLCQPIPPPPPAFVIALPKPDPTLTKRERFDQHRTDPKCAGCHETMDPTGFGFEHYDAQGAWRTVDGAFPVDALGVLSGTRDVDGRFDGAVALGARLAGSEQVRRCVATQWFRAALGRGERPEDQPSLESAYQTFARAGFDVRDLLVAIATTDAFRHVGFEPQGAVAPGTP